MKNIFCIENQIDILKSCYKKVEIEKGGATYKTVQNCIMSGIAMFSLKYPSLLQFNESRNEEPISHNLKSLYKINFIPSDTYMREVLDEVSPDRLRSGYKGLFRLLQSSKKLRQYQCIGDSYLLAIDGTGFFKSKGSSQN